MYPDYLIHYNKNHSKANGQFVSGDGDGDGIANDHAHRSESGRAEGTIKKKSMSKGARIGLGIGLGVIGTAAVAAGAIGLGKTIADANRTKKIKESTAAAMKGKSYIEIKGFDFNRVQRRAEELKRISKYEGFKGQVI